MDTSLGGFRWKEVKGQKPQVSKSLNCSRSHPKHTCDYMQLFNADGRSVLYWKCYRYPQFGQAAKAKEKPYLVVDPEIQPVLDRVLVGFVIMRRIINRRHE